MEKKPLKPTLTDHIITIIFIIIVFSGIGYGVYYLFFRGYEIKEVVITGDTNFKVVLNREFTGYYEISFEMITPTGNIPVYGHGEDKKESILFGSTCKTYKMNKRCDYFSISPSKEFKKVNLKLTEKGVFKNTKYNIEYIK